MSYAPPALVEGITRQPLPFGLFSVLSFRPEGDGRWQNGVLFESENCAPARVLSEQGCYPAENSPMNLEGDPPADGEGTPFSVYGWSSCTPVGKTLDEIQQEAQRHLLAREENAVETALWDGDPGVITEGAFNIHPPTVSIAAGIGLLEKYLGSMYGSQGVIHMTREVALLALADDLLQVQGNRLTTRLGTPVAAGSGYSGAVRGDGSYVDRSAIYATPALLAYRSGVINDLTAGGGGFNRAINDAEAVALRTYVVAADTCVRPAYVTVNLPDRTSPI